MKVANYDANYEHFSTALYATIRREAFGDDIGQHSWLTADEHDLFIRWMGVNDTSRVLDVACGSGRTTLRIAQRTGCSVHGVDIHDAAITEARSAAEQAGLTNRARFTHADASGRLSFDDEFFDAAICVDAINHLPNRPAVLNEWARVLKSGAVLVFTDPIVVTGPLTSEDMTIRSSIGFFVFVPPGVDERYLDDAGFDVTDVVDRTENMAVTAWKRMQARHRYAKELRIIEGDETFEGQQRFLETASQLAADRRLSRFAFRAVRR